MGRELLQTSSGTNHAFAWRDSENLTKPQAGQQVSGKYSIHIYGSFNVTINIWHWATERTANKELKGCGRKWWCPNLRFYLSMWLVELRETSVRMAGILVKIWRQDLRHTKRNLHHSITSSDEAIYTFSNRKAVGNYWKGLSCQVGKPVESGVIYILCTTFANKKETI